MSKILCSDVLLFGFKPLKLAIRNNTNGSHFSLFCLKHVTILGPTFVIGLYYQLHNFLERPKHDDP